MGSLRISKNFISFRLIFPPFLVAILFGGTGFGQTSISLSRTDGPPSTVVLVSGNGFKPNSTVDLYFDSKLEVSTQADGAGTFSNVPVHAPDSASPGKHRIGAVDHPGDMKAQAPFWVHTNWSQFHFNSVHSGLNPYENVLDSGNVIGLNLKWDFTTGSPIDSSPAVEDGTVFVGSDQLYALNVSTGKLLWSYKTPGPVETPAVANGVVFVGDGQYSIYAVNAKTGVLLWTTQVEGCTLQGYAELTPSALNVKDGVVYFGSRCGTINAVKADTGDVLWSYATGNTVESSPAVVNGIVYCGSNDGFMYALRADTGALIWKFQTGGTYGAVDSSPAVVDGVVYFGALDGSLHALNAATGVSLWSYQTASSIESSPAVDGGVVYIGSDDGNVYAIAANDGTLVWSFQTADENVFSSPALANGVLYVGGGGSANDPGYLYALNEKTSEPLWSYVFNEDIESSPVVANGIVYIGSHDNGGFYAFSLGATTLRPVH